MRIVPFVSAAVLLLTASAVLSPSPVLPALPGGAAAPLDLPTPKNGERVDGKVAEGFGRFFDDVAAEWGLPKGAGEPASVFVWEGDAYKPGRGRLAWGTLRRLLADAGFEIEEFEKTDVRTNVFMPRYGLSAVDDATEGNRVRLTAWMGQGFFKATNARTGTTLAGMWADLEQEKQAVVAYGRVGFQAARRVEGVPAFVPGPNEVLVPGLDAAAVLRSSAAKPPAFAPLQPRRRAARGRVVDAAGRPIVGAQVAAQTSLAGGLRTTTRGKTNAQGVYDFPLPQGAAQVVEASCEVRYDGQPVTLQLTPADGELDYFPADKGHVENFVLRMTGANTASMRILRWDIPEDGKGVIQVKLAPDGPLLDGSRGKTLVFRFPNKTTNTELYLAGVPIGKYTMTATFFHDGEEAPMRLEATFDPEGKKLDRLPIVFKTQHNPHAASFGTEQFEVTLRP